MSTKAIDRLREQVEQVLKYNRKRDPATVDYRINLSLADARAIANDVLVSEVIEKARGSQPLNCSGCFMNDNNYYCKKEPCTWDLDEIKKLIYAAL